MIRKIRRRIIVHAISSIPSRGKWISLAAYARIRYPRNRMIELRLISFRLITDFEFSRVMADGLGKLSFNFILPDEGRYQTVLSAASSGLLLCFSRICIPV
jgi:hypothetical protein